MSAGIVRVKTRHKQEACFSLTRVNRFASLESVYCIHEGRKRLHTGDDGQSTTGRERSPLRRRPRVRIQGWRIPRESTKRKAPARSALPLGARRSGSAARRSRALRARLNRDETKESGGSPTPAVLYIRRSLPALLKRHHTRQHAPIVTGIEEHLAERGRRNGVGHRVSVCLATVCGVPAHRVLPDWTPTRGKGAGRNLRRAVRTGHGDDT
jgi:hypothetical protein